VLLSHFLTPRFIYTLHLPGERHLGVQSRVSPGRAALSALGKNGASQCGGDAPTSAAASLLLAPRAKAALCSAWTRPAIEADQGMLWKSK